ncbi:hypothetical protein [Nocardioides sp. T2.26MG-1]|uniref:hypothetical protein n=1 Tax=Nocardioides sp. T2.26MG-1 TaxID=3041166 RepID=UPI002477C17E|nr:hypothetical protein [Nocardioides sp. T2.26MG-1]CAI9418917.1 hypothetical protein HIDPHFAB_03437 [Nocardioides sp. T2.26MG-1]
MTPTHDLKDALGLVAETGRPVPDPGDDLARAQGAARARTRRRFRVGLAGLAVVSVLGVGSATLLDGTDQRTTQVSPGGVQLVAERFDAAPYSFDLTPRGWSVQGQRPQTVTIAPDDGSTSSHPDDFVGKLVIMFDANPPDGREVEHDGRTFWVSDSGGGYTTMATRTRGDEPAGVVRIQYPRDAGWDEDSMLAFLASVHVGDTAQLGMG